MTGQRIGYRRVSAIDQNTARQLDGVAIDKAFEDKASGKNTARPQLQAALEFCREGDTLVVHSMDRLARNLTDLRLLVKDLTNRGVAVQFVKESLTFTGEDSPMANLLLSMLGAVAEFERCLDFGAPARGHCSRQSRRQIQGAEASSVCGQDRGDSPARGGRRIEGGIGARILRKPRNALLLLAPTSSVKQTISSSSQ